MLKQLFQNQLLPLNNMATCKICGKELTKPGWDKEDICGDCNFWQEVADDFNNPEQIHYTIISNGKRMHIQGHIHKALVDKSKLTPVKTAFLGFGGHDWYIKDKDDVIHHYNNLWCRGDVPKNFYDKFPVNGVVVTEQEFNDQQQ